MSATFIVNLRVCGYEIFARLKGYGYTLTAADMGGEDVRGIQKTKAGKRALIIGGEARGLSREARAAADRTAAVKTEGIESLNAAVSGAIIMHQLS
jgi:tRNA G18 (ribose-2'-O)-methylase SpoU